jgi:PAS domain S-box-containing protein
MTVLYPEIQIVSDTAKRLLTCSARGEFAGILLEQMSACLGVTGGSVFQFKNDRLHRLASLDPSHVPEVVDLPVRPGTPLGQCVFEKKPLRLNIRDATETLTTSGWSGYECDTCLLLPMLDREQNILGIVSLHNKASGEFDEQDLEMGSLLANLATESFRGLAEREERQRLALAVSQALDAIVVTSLDGVVTYLNPAALELLGGDGDTSATLTGAVSRFIRPEVAESQQEQERLQAILAGEGWRGRIQRRTPRGQTVQIEEVVSPVRDENGRLVNMVHAFHDVTREAALQGQLMQAQKMEAVGALAAGIAHEINTPTQYIGDNIRFFRDGFADLLQVIELVPGEDVEDAAALKQAFQAIRAKMEEVDMAFLLEEIPTAIEQSLEGNSRVADIVRAMKEFAHPGAEEFCEADINSCLRNTISVSRNEWKYAAELVCDFERGLPSIHCDASALNQVFLNLIVNAGHAIAARQKENPDHRGEIRIVTRWIDDAVQVSITDNGTGIPQEVMPNIFDPFFTTKPVGKGTGQGLAISHTVVAEQHGGSITVDSQLGEGTTFTVTIPGGVEGRSKDADKA